MARLHIALVLTLALALASCQSSNSNTDKSKRATGNTAPGKSSPIKHSNIMGKRSRPANSGSSSSLIPKPSFEGPSIAPQPAPVAIAPPKSTPTVKTAAPVTATGPAQWKPAVGARNWRWIVVHHSATPAGGARAFDKMHKDKGWDGLGYHFVIGNGSDTKDGLIEVGPRWPVQKWGAHTKTADNQFNDYGIGICLVGNFEIDRPTPEQIRSLTKLTAYLMKTYRIPPDRIIGHGDAKSTDCPGRNLSVATLRRLALQLAAGTGDGSDPAVSMAIDTELFADEPQ